MRADADIEEQLSDFAVGVTWDRIPAMEQEFFRLLLLDGVACGLAGRSAPGRSGFARAARELGGPGTYVVMGDRPAGVSGSVLLNAWQTTAMTMCDVYRPAMCHVTPVVLPAILAGLHRSQVSREEFLAAFAVAVEVTVRLCSAMEPELYRGARWHAPGVIGPFGSATAVGRLRGRSQREMRRAWGASLLHASGTFSAIGSPSVKVTQARAAWAGVAAHEFAQVGHGGTDRPFSHPDGGLFEAYGGRAPDRAVHALGEDWVAVNLALRRWPAASSLQSLVEAVMLLAGRSPSPLPASIDIALPAQSYKLCGEAAWNDHLSSLQSARWVASVVWADRACWTEQFSADRRADGELSRFAEERVRVAVDESLGDGAVRIAVPGDVLIIDAPLGSPSRPLSAPQLAAKLSAAAGEHRAGVLQALVDGQVDWSARRWLEVLGGTNRPS